MKRMNISSLLAGAFALSISGMVCANAQQINPATTTETPAPAVSASTGRSHPCPDHSGTNSHARRTAAARDRYASAGTGRVRHAGDAQRRHQ